MRPYAEHPSASLRMHDSASLRTLLRATIARERINHVLESGTHLGLGSTTMIAESFPSDAPPEQFITLEAKWANWRQAQRNLARFPFVRCEWGLSVSRAAALAFIEADEFLMHHEQYPEPFIDDTNDPVGFYTREVRGGRVGGVVSRARLRHPGRYALDLALHALPDRSRHFAGEGRLAYWLTQMRHARPLIVLDSAGGIGWMEFTVMRETMGDRPYIVLLDDIHHVKHWRSRVYVEGDPAFTILGSVLSEGWLLAQHG